MTVHKELETDKDRADLEEAAHIVASGVDTIKIGRALRQRVLTRIRSRAFRARRKVNG